MLNEEFLNEKFCMSRYGKKEWLEEAKATYLLKQVDWMEKYLCDTYPNLSGNYIVNYTDNNDKYHSTTGSCLLEAIENAQKEMNNV